MSLVDPQAFRRRWVQQLESVIERVEQRTREWPEEQRKTALVVLAEVASEYPDLLALSRRLNEETEYHYQIVLESRSLVKRRPRKPLVSDLDTPKTKDPPQ